MLGAGLDTFAQRRPEIAARLRVFEIDRPGTQAWKRRRLIELGYGIPDRLRLVPVDFEAGADWWEQLSDAGFDPGRPTVVACTGVTMYLTKDATAATLRRLALLAPGSTLAMTFMTAVRPDPTTGSGFPTPTRSSPISYAGQPPRGVGACSTWHAAPANSPSRCAARSRTCGAWTPNPA